MKSVIVLWILSAVIGNSQLVNGILRNGMIVSPTPYYENYLPTFYWEGLLAYYPMGETAAPLVDASLKHNNSQAVGGDAPVFAQSYAISNTLRTSVRFPLNATPANTHNFIALEAAFTNRLRATNWTLGIWFSRAGTGSAGASGTGTGGIIAEPLLCKGGAESETATFNMNWGFGLELITNPDGSTGNLYVSADYEKDNSGNLTSFPTGRNGRMMDVATLSTTVTNLSGAAATDVPTAMPYLVGDRVRFGGTSVGAGVTAARWYWITATPTTNTFQVASTQGGSAIALSTVAAGGGAWINHARAVTTLSPTDTNWHFGVATWDGSNLKCYLDGVLVENETPTQKPPEAITQQRATIAGYGTTTATVNGYWNGNLQHASIWSIALSAQSISNLYRCGIYQPTALVVPNAPPIAPSIAAQPNAGTPVNRTANATMSVTAAGTAPLTYQWQLKGTNLVAGGHASGYTTATLTITGATEIDGGDYKCLVSNAAGSVLSAASKVVIYHATDDGSHLMGNIAVLGDRESGFDATRATAVDNAILADTEITNVISVGDLAASTETYQNNNDVLKAAIQSRGGNIFPTIGNHDYDTTNETYVGVYFSGISSNNNSGLFYYSQRFADAEVFFYDDNTEQGTTNGGGFSATAAAVQASTMGQWLLNRIASSTAPWKILISHHPAYTDSVDGNNSGNQWTLNTIGVNLYIQGHAHGIERIYTNSIFYYTAAMGGAVHHNWSTKFSQTEFRVETPGVGSDTNGFMKICTSPTKMILEYYDTRGTNLDRTVLTQ